MQAFSFSHRPSRTAAGARRRAVGNAGGKRRGSVLLVVIGLLGVLLLLGFMFFSFATYESNSAQSFSEAAKVREVQLSTEVMWDWALEQLIVGPDDYLQQSALWGGRRARQSPFGRHSLLGNMFDKTYSPYSGGGVHVIWDPTKLPTQYVPVVDQNHDGVADSNTNPPSATVFDSQQNQNFLMFNYSPAATGNYSTSNTEIAKAPSAASDYTYPDINNLFLAYVGSAAAPQNGNPTNMTSVIVPSFHRGQLLYDPNTGTFDTNWYNTGNTARKVFRPHPSHMIAGTSTRRFTSDFPFAPPTAGQFDVDLDGDTTKEAVLIDLDYPVQELPDGRKYIPLFAFTIIDLDGLINLNAHGNLAGYKNQLNNNSQAFGYDTVYSSLLPISRSNLGATPSEVNPFWALRDFTGTNSFPGANDPRFYQYQKLYGKDPGSRSEIANMDLWALLCGRPQYDSAGNVIDLFTGRWGDRDRLDRGVDNLGNNNSYNLAVYHPQPGAPQADDDYDQYTGESSFPAVVSPIDFRGGGNHLDFSTYRTGRPRLFNNTGSKLVQYDSYNNSAGNVTWGKYVPNLMTYNNSPLPSNHLLDHPAETILARKESLLTPHQFNLQSDSIFGPQENESLHKSDNDPDKALVGNAIRRLMPWAFGTPVTESDSDATARRKQFGFNSSDRKQFGLPHFPGERTWEFNADFDGDSGWEFPPAFVNQTSLSANEPFRPELRKALEVEEGDTRGGKKQLRWDLNKVWSSSIRDNGGTLAQSVAQYANLQAYQRPLTPHVVSEDLNENGMLDAGEDLNGNGVLDLLTRQPLNVANIGVYGKFASTEAQELWARRDRQQMARDIFVMLYTLCGGPATDGVTTPAAITYTPRQVKEMAQFAVNVVDAIDTDDVITAFYYPTTLASGWDANDNFGGSGDVVYGVERQHLAINEVSVFKHRAVMGGGTPKDHRATLLDDSKVDDEVNNPYRYYAYTELLNTTAGPLSLNGGYRLVHYNPMTKTAWRSVNVKVKTRLGAGGVFNIGCRTHVPGTDEPGGIPYSATFKMKHDWQVGDVPTEGDMNMFIPASHNEPSDPFYLDLITDHDVSDYAITDDNDALMGNHTGNRDRFLDFLTQLPTGNNQQITYVLQRRLNTNRQAPMETDGNYDAQSDDNPWIEIDRMTVEVATFTSDDTKMRESLMDDTTYSGNPFTEDFQHAYEMIHSSERRNPLDGTAYPVQAGNFGGNPQTSNSLGGQNSSVSGNVWQPHFDRGLINTGELLSIPLYGPQYLTSKLSKAGYLVSIDLTDNAWDNADASDPAGDRKYPFRTAQSKVFMPSFPDQTATNPSNPNWHALYVTNKTTADFGDNRWYRFFEFVTVTDRQHQHPDGNGNPLANYMKSPVTMGKINLNTIRHRGVLFGLLDAPEYFGSTDANFLTDLYEPNPTSRSWYQQFLFSRDGYEPTVGAYVPGAVGSRPFRALNFYGDAFNATGYDARTEVPLESTIFRSLPADAIGDLDGDNVPDAGETGIALAGNRRRLFQVGKAADFLADRDSTQMPGNEYVDYHTRNRLLSKVMANSTTRSHCFVCWIGVDFFEAIEAVSEREDANDNGQLDPGEDKNGNGVLDRFYQVGKQLPTADARGHRMISVIDRSEVEQAYDATTGKFNFRPLVIYQRTIE